VAVYLTKFEYTLNSRSAVTYLMARLFLDQRGVSAIVGLVLVVAIALGVGVSTYISSWVPNEQEQREYDAMREIEQSFRELKRSIESLESGREASVRIKLGAEPVSFYAYQRGHAELEAHPPRYVDWFSPVADTYVDESLPTTPFGSDNVLRVSPTAGGRQRSYLRFDLRYTSPGWRSGLYSYENLYEDDAVIHQAKLWLYIDNVNLRDKERGQLDIEVPVTIEARSLESDTWPEGMTWATQPSAENRPLENQTVDEQLEWVSFDVTPYVRRLHENIIENQLAGGPAAVRNNLVSFILMEPMERASLLTRRAAFISKDVDRYYREDVYGGRTYNYDPYLEIVFSRGARAGRMRKELADAGYIKFSPTNLRFPPQQFIYEGGAVIQQQRDWYDIMIDPPNDFIKVEPADGNNIRVTVTRYRITLEGARAGLIGRWVSGTGWATVSVSIVGETYLTKAGEVPNEEDVTITIRTDFPRAWRDWVRKQLVPRLNFDIGGEWDEYGGWATYDYDRLSVTIYGKDKGQLKDLDDIYFTERVVDLLVSVR